MMGIRNKPGFKLPPQARPNHKGKGPPLKVRGTRRWHVIEALVKKHGLETGVELGLWEGKTTEHLLENCHDLVWMMGVDLWKEQPDNPGPEDYVGWDHEQHEKTCRERLARFGDRATVFKGATLSATSVVRFNSLGFVFFDADHSTPALLRDLELWVPRIKEDGWLIGHDINWPSVQAALDQYVGPGRVSVSEDNTWYIQKNQL